MVILRHRRLTYEKNSKAFLVHKFVLNTVGCGSLSVDFERRTVNVLIYSLYLLVNINQKANEKIDKLFKKLTGNQTIKELHVITSVPIFQKYLLTQTFWPLSRIPTMKWCHIWRNAWRKIVIWLPWSWWGSILEIWRPLSNKKKSRMLMCQILQRDWERTQLCKVWS